MQLYLQFPEQFNAADYFVDRNIRENKGHRTAVICEDRSFTYADIQAGMDRAGNALKEYVKKTLAHYKYPRWIEFVDELPKTATGKIKRFELRNLSFKENDDVAAQV